MSQKIGKGGRNRNYLRETTKGLIFLRDKIESIQIQEIDDKNRVAAIAAVFSNPVVIGRPRVFPTGFLLLLNLRFHRQILKFSSPSSKSDRSSHLLKILVPSTSSFLTSIFRRSPSECAEYWRNLPVAVGPDGNQFRLLNDHILQEEKRAPE